VRKKLLSGNLTNIVQAQSFTRKSTVSQVRELAVAAWDEFTFPDSFGKVHTSKRERHIIHWIMIPDTTVFSLFENKYKDRVYSLGSNVFPSISWFYKQRQHYHMRTKPFDFCACRYCIEAVEGYTLFRRSLRRFALTLVVTIENYVPN